MWTESAPSKMAVLLTTATNLLPSSKPIASGHLPRLQNNQNALQQRRLRLKDFTSIQLLRGFTVEPTQELHWFYIGGRVGATILLSRNTHKLNACQSVSQTSTVFL